MRDPLTWSLPMGRLFGINIRVHLLFPVVALGLVLRVAFQKDAPHDLWIEAIFLVLILFVSVLLHEFGHCFAARAVDGDANEILLWPLGGLAFVEVPHTPRANFIATAGGPAVNVLIGVVACALLATQSVLPSFKPWASPYTPVVYSWSEQVYYGSKTGRGDLWKFVGYKESNNSNGPVSPEKKGEGVAVYYHPDEVAFQPDPSKGPDQQTAALLNPEGKPTTTLVHAEPMTQHSVWIVLLARIFWVNWFLFLLNLVPAFPLDGGRMLQSVLWWRTDYRQATLWAIGAGFVFMFIFIVLALITSEVWVLLLAAFIYVSCRRQWIVLETGGEEGLFGYDFSQGYTSLERDQPAPPPRRRPNWFQRWLHRRAERRMRRDQEQRETEERRMDELLAKVQSVGLQGLTDEERRFLTRVSAKYRRNRQE
jgi:Zn-dependent protease